MKKVKTVAFHNLGCKVNAYEMEVMQQKFIESGLQIVPFDSIADVYVINTCSVTNIADRKSRQMLHRAKKTNPDAVVIAAGCYSQTDTEGARADDSVDIIIGNNHKTEIVDILNEYLSKNDKAADSKTTAVSDLTDPVSYEEGGINDSNERTRVDIKIQDGCNQFCTYCIIPYARGRIRSRSIESVIDEVKRLADKGFKEVVLTGIHLSSYGIDLNEHSSYNAMTKDGEYTNRALLDVIEAVSAVDGIKRVRLGSLEPRVITREFLNAISSNETVCPHFHLSLQSGCDATLKRMNRKYTTDEYYEKVQLLREYYDKPAITTDIITGFPGEDEAEFNETVEFVKKVKFYETHLFKYSKRKGTVAATLPGQNTEAVKAGRSDVLQQICEINREEFIRAHIGKECEVLIEEEKMLDGKTVYTGHTRDYVPLITDFGMGPVSELCKPKSKPTPNPGDIYRVVPSDICTDISGSKALLAFY